MNAVANAETYEPRDVEQMATIHDFAREAARRSRLVAEPRAKLVRSDGASVELTDELVEVLVVAAENLAQNRAVTLLPTDQQLTTQQAADMLGVTRPTLTKLVDRGDIPCQMVGRHRRITLRDLLAYQDHQSSQRRAALQEMADIARENDLYRATAVSPEGIR